MQVQFSISFRAILLVAFGFIASGAFAADFFVAAKGDDTLSGAREQPFASFQRVQQAVHAERAIHPADGINVTFLAGKYLMDRPIVFTALDSGASAVRPVCYRAEPGGAVIFSGERLLANWKPDPQHPGVWKTRVAEPKADDDFAWRFEQLWVNGRRAVRARTPNEGAFATLLSFSEEPASDATQRVRHIFTTSPVNLSTLQSLDKTALADVQVVAYHNWDTTREWLTSAAPPEGLFITSGDKVPSWNPIKRDCRFFIENYLGALDAPGEWFLARDGWLYYLPRQGEVMSTAQAVSSRVERFLVFAGNVENPNERVQHLQFEGLEFQFADFRIPGKGIPASQSAVNVEAAVIQFEGARDILFRNCAVEHIGTTAFWFRQACRDCRVEHTRMFDLGISGMRIGEANSTNRTAPTGGITVDNCIIQTGGRVVPHAAGVLIGHSANNCITHCDIADFFYTAVSVGWVWGYGKSDATNNRIEYNHLHHIGCRVLSEMGGVYTLGPSPGTRVSHNVIHDIYAARYGGWGLYADEGSSFILFECNLVYNVFDGCIHQHYGRENVFRNNILAFSDEGQVAITSAEPHLSFTFERNLIYWDRGRPLGYSGWERKANVILRSNLYWRQDGKPFDFNGNTWEAWTNAGNDLGSIIADPLFVDPKRRDFRLRAGSPAEKIGFQPFDFTNAGVYGIAAWKQLANSTDFPKP